MKEIKKALNDEIKASKVKLIDEAWEAIWEMTLSEAKQKARELSLDLMEIAKNENFSIIKMLDYWKFLYKQKKVDTKNKRKWKAPDLKTVKITFKIWDHDLEVKKNQAQKFSSWWHPLKIVLSLRWRENHYEDIAKQKMESFVSMLEEFYKLDNRISKNWNNFIAMMIPK